MSIIKAEYRHLSPDLNLLTDITILAQAWKKTHQYIRRHNWYADVLELDMTAFNLEAQLAEWSEEVKSKNFKPHPLRLVPAPKNQAWSFRDTGPVRKVSDNFLDLDLADFESEPSFEDWAPIEDKTEVTETKGDQLQPVRPLAHLRIRDQVLATSVMLCLANYVETAQGDPGLKVIDAHSKGVVSYGNRLHCMWRDANERRIANFSWGNSRSYSDYFQHYRTFLARPEIICSEISGRIPHDRELFVVNLDIKSFFDRIDREALIVEIKHLVAEQSETVSRGVAQKSIEQRSFWRAVRRITNWTWDTSDHDSLAGFTDVQPKDSIGLPQGLMASGFFANAYMARFDELMYSIYQSEQTDEEIKVHDYCRYVDDIRIVISAPRNMRSGENLLSLTVGTQNYMQKLLDEHFRKLDVSLDYLPKINENKSEIQPYSSISKYGRVSALMQSMNGDLSGPLDMDTLRELSGGLEGLLSLSEQLSTQRPIDSRLALAGITAPTSDVRDDTVKRFVATRLARSLRKRLAMAEDEQFGSIANYFSQDSIESSKALAHEFENTARRLIQIWSMNPSLGLLLRCGLDLYPHPRLLEPVLEALELKISGDLSKECEQRQVITAYYVIADLLRAGAVETGQRGESEYTEGIDLDGYRYMLSGLAKRMLNDKNEIWYVKQQAYLYLASVGDTSRFSKQSNVQDELTAYRKLLRAIRYCDVKSSELPQYLPLALVAQQIRPNHDAFIHWFTDQVRQARTMDAEEAVSLLALNTPELLAKCLSAKSSRANSWKKHVPKDIKTYHREVGSSRSQRPVSEATTLLRAIANTNNPFDNENALLALARALLLKILPKDGDSDFQRHRESLEKGATASNINLSCTNWLMLPSLNELIVVTDITSNSEGWPLYEMPPWVAEEKAWLYALGRLLRSALTGELDFSARRFLLQDENTRYSGLRSTWFQRRFGLLNKAAGLLQEPAPISPWLSSFLTALLQWPGISVRDEVAQSVGAVNTPSQLLEIVEERIATQRLLYGARCRTPIYSMPTSDSPIVNRPLRIAIVQPLRPRLSEFDSKDPLHWTKSEMTAHRRHLAEVCKLTKAKVNAWSSAQIESEERESEQCPQIDLILFPELSVHPEHIDLLRTLSDSLHATIFAGLTFIYSPKAGGVTNQGLWLIRTNHEGDGRRHEYIWQGKKFPMKLEVPLGIRPHRPHITLVEFPVGVDTPTRVAAAICYDATDLDLVADLRERSDIFLVAALNKDVQTFDNMVTALHYHMYQPVILANNGEFGGSTAQAPFPKFEKTISHIHGSNQVAVSIFEIEPSLFKQLKTTPPTKELKTAPAGYKGRPL